MEGAALIISAFSAAYGTKSSMNAKAAAKDQQKLQEQQLAEQRQQELLQRRQAIINARRQQRVKLATMQAQSYGQGVESGAVFGTELSSVAQLENQISLINQFGTSQQNQFDIASEQYNLQASITSDKADAAIGTAVGSFASTLFAPETLDLFKSKQEETAAQTTIFEPYKDTSNIA